MVLESSSFDLSPGKTVALIGPNGSGKTTLMHMIAGLKEPSAGRIWVGGKQPREQRDRISYVFQANHTNQHMPVTVTEVVRMGRYTSTGWWGRFSGSDRDRTSQILSLLDIEDLADQHLCCLSGGQRQRVFVAQGLVQDHDYLLLDEPITGLDMVSTVLIERMIREESKGGKTVLFSTHDLLHAERAEQVILLSGRVVAWGEPSQVLVPEILQQAYGHHLLEKDGQLWLDDAAHISVNQRHFHQNRSIHLEPPGSDLHPS